VATVGVASYRIAQNFLPILVGGVFYASLRIGPWSIARRERLARLRTLAHQQEEGRESQLDFLMRAWPKRLVPKMPDVEVPAQQREEAARADAIVSLETIEHRLTGDEPDPPA
jgi:hypothetical protein